MIHCNQPLESFKSAQSWRKHIGWDRAFWHSTRSIKQDLISMARRYDPPHTMSSPLRSMDGVDTLIVISCPLGVQTHNAIVQQITLPIRGHTPQWQVCEYYDDTLNENTFVARRRESCVGCMARIMVNNPERKSTEPRIKYVRKTCVVCKHKEAGVYCTLCHQYFHARLKYLPESEPKLIAVDAGKRTRGGDRVYIHIENNCFNMWHAEGRKKAWGGVQERVLP